MNKGDLITMGNKIVADMVFTIESEGGKVSQHSIDLRDFDRSHVQFLGERMTIMGQVDYEDASEPGEKKVFCFNLQFRPSSLKVNPDFVPPPRMSRPGILLQQVQVQSGEKK